MRTIPQLLGVAKRRHRGASGDAVVLQCELEGAIEGHDGLGSRVGRLRLAFLGARSPKLSPSPPEKVDAREQNPRDDGRYRAAPAGRQRTEVEPRTRAQTFVAPVDLVEDAPLLSKVIADDVPVPVLG